MLPCPREGNAEFEGFILAGADQRWYPAKARHAKLDGAWSIELSSDLVPEPVAARYGWANWPTGNMVGRNRLPMPTFRTDDWPIPRGVSYSKEAEAESKKALDELKLAARYQALDRKLRQAQFDVPRLEADLFKGDVRSQLESKVARLAAVLDELQGDGWLPSRVSRQHAAVAEQVEALRQGVETLQAQVAAIDEK
ncbi:MAG: hypothetical protein GY711_10435 [bacterium]|nr:hypothetical protein [bacterium]